MPDNRRVEIEDFKEYKENVRILLSSDKYTKDVRAEKGKKIRLLKKKHLKVYHPDKDWKFPCESLAKEIRQYEDDREVIKEYKKYNRFLYSTRGYLKVIGTENHYVPVLRFFLFIWIWRFSIAAAVIAGAIIFGPELWRGKPTTTPDIPVSYNDDSAEQGDPDNPQISIPGREKITIDADGVADMPLVNPEGNPCYFVCSLIVDDQVIYQSEMIPPGKMVQNYTVTKTLPAGEYQGYLKYECYKIGTLQQLNGSNVELKVIFK